MGTKRHVLIVSALLMVAFAGYIKGAPALVNLPVDLTLVAGVVVALVMAHRALADRLRAMRGSQYVLLLAGTFLIGLPVGLNESNYPMEKSLELFILGMLLSLAGAMYILRTERERTLWLQANILLGLLVIALAYFFPNVIEAESERLAIQGGNTISAGRASGAAVVVLVILAMSSKRRWKLSLLVALLLAAATVSIGSRGPVFAALVAIVVVLAPAGNRGQGVRLLLGSAALAGTAYMALELNLVADRLFSTTDNSAEARRTLWSQSLKLIPQHPFGIGWGRLQTHLAPWAVLDRAGEKQYAHNVLLEVFTEGGWLAGLALILVLAVAFVRQRNAATTPTEMAMLGLFVFHVLNAMVSGDVGGNRGMWVAVGAALILPTHFISGVDEQRTSYGALRALDIRG